MQLWKHASMKTKGKSLTDLGQISCIAHAYLRQLSGKLSRISGKSQSNPRHILGKVWANLRISQIFLHICLHSSVFSIVSVVQSFTCSSMDSKKILTYVHRKMLT